MNCKHLRVALLAGSIVAAMALPARADDCCGTAASCCAPAFKTICVKEWVPESYTYNVTVYTRECREETYTAYKCETVPETRTRTCTVYHTVPETRTIMKTVCERVPCVEQRTVCKKVWVNQPCTEVVKKCVDKGHWDCQTVECGPSFLDHLKGLKGRFHKGCGGCGDDCGGCGSCGSCETTCACPRTKTKKVWVSCPTIEEHCVTRCKRVCETHQETCNVTTYKTVSKQVPCTVTCNRCVAEQKTETYTVCVTHKVPVQCKRTVSVCVPHQETRTGCKMVCHTVQKQVPCCETTCCSSRAHGEFLKGLLARLHSHKSCGCDSGCGGGCDSCGSAAPAPAATPAPAPATAASNN
jgi:hypothetical protein